MPDHSFVSDLACPACGEVGSLVVDSRGTTSGTYIRRRRHCTSCERRFTTHERIVEEPMKLFQRKAIQADSSEEVLAYAEQHVIPYLNPAYSWTVRTREVSTRFWEYQVFRGAKLEESDAGV